MANSRKKLKRMVKAQHEMVSRLRSLLNEKDERIADLKALVSLLRTEIKCTGFLNI